MDLVPIARWLEQVTGIPLWVLVIGVSIIAYAVIYKYYRPHFHQKSTSSEVKNAIDQLIAAVNQNTADINELKQFIQAESWRVEEDPLKVMSFGFIGERRVALCQIPDLESGYRQIYWPCSEDGALVNRELLEELAKLGRLPFKAEPPGATSTTDFSVPLALEAPPQEVKDLVPIEVAPLTLKVGANGNPVEVDPQNLDVDFLSKFDEQLKASSERSVTA